MGLAGKEKKFEAGHFLARLGKASGYMGSMTNEETTSEETNAAQADAVQDSAVEALDQLFCLRFARPALDLRLAMLIAWFKRNDVLPLGYASFSAFARDQVELSDSWMRALVRLVEADLPLVKRAVSLGIVHCVTLSKHRVRQRAKKKTGSFVPNGARSGQWTQSPGAPNA
jgi:hypothetical protein